jgi:NAD(P)-dependent dehydrogenase (short-subunit alcohol dehydrogenase family)
MLRISVEDMDLFAAASGDVNPLHVSQEYARQTPFGERVVYGALAVLAVCRDAPARPGYEVASIQAEFRAPLALGVSYLPAVEAGETETHATLRDGAALLLDVRIAFRRVETRSALDDGDPVRGDPVRGDQVRRTVPAALSLTDLHEGWAKDGAWAPSVTALRRLSERFELARAGVDELAVAALLWSSYVIGMEIPGERALFWKLGLELPPRRGAANVDLPLPYSIGVSRVSDGFAAVSLDVALRSGDETVARGSLGAFVREDSPRPDAAALRRLLPEGRSLENRVALVIGGSRGLGASVAQACALQGARVVLVYRDSVAAAERVRAELGEDGDRIETIRGDASDAEWCRKVLRPVVLALGNLDLLVCNASPPIRPLSLAPETLERFEQFVDQSLRLAVAPTTTLAEDVSAAAGTILFVSSTALETLPREWPHYVTAKAALEGFATWIAAAHPKLRVLVVRPPKLLTDQMNTVMGRVDAHPVEEAAAALLRIVSDATRSGVVDLDLGRPRSDSGP